MRFDVFCRVIDNHGDVGVCWRLCRELGERGHEVRLWIDDASALAWMAPEGHPHVLVIPAQAGIQGVLEPPGDVVIEAFGCDIPEPFIDAMRGRGSKWINLEYLSAEPYVERSHGLRSPVREGLEKHFFYPGFTPRTGGLLRENDLAARQARFTPPAANGERTVSLFCYEPATLPALLLQLAQGEERTRLRITAGRAHAAVRAALPALDAAEPGWNAAGRLTLDWLPLLSQRDYDELLASCDFNFVRGEDSLVRAIWAGRPFAWQLYPQDDGAHFDKLQAFLDWLAPPPDQREWFRAWNGAPGAVLPPLAPAAWGAAARAARERALALPELASALLQFVERGTI